MRAIFQNLTGTIADMEIELAPNVGDTVRLFEVDYYVLKMGWQYGENEGVVIVLVKK